MSELAQRLDALLRTMTQLIELIEAENKALAAHHPERVAQSVDRKLLLSRTLEGQMQQIGPLREALRTRSPKDRLRFVASLEHLQNVGKINQTVIDAARRAVERVVGHIVEAVRKHNNTQPTRYSRPSLAPQRPNARPLSININQVF